LVLIFEHWIHFGNDWWKVGLERQPSPDGLRGAQGNITSELFACVQARHHVVSTNGAIFGHPDDTAIARAILHGGRGQTLWFNHGNERNRRWGAGPLQARYGYSTRYLAELEVGVTLALMAAA
jgi:hypothetical protein